MRYSTYHSILRIAALTFAVVLLFDSGLLAPVTKQLSLDTQDYLAQSIGMYAGVAPTELNQLTAELTKRDSLLDQRESDLAAREIKVDLQKNAVSNGYSTYILSVILFLILVLLVLNYALDFARAPRSAPTYGKMA